MSHIHLTGRDIERWVPGDISQIVGCDRLKEYFRNQLINDANGTNTLVTGEPGTGKTAAVKAFVRSLMCPHREPQTQLPCGTCNSCRNFDVRYGDVGLHAYAQGRAIVGGEVINYYPVNCGGVTETQLREMLKDRVDYHGKFLIYLDEVHRIVRRGMDHLLLKPLEEMDALWIASTARPAELDPMFLRRFSVKLTTSPPTREDLVEFLTRRCKDWGINVDDEATLVTVATRSRLVTSNAVSALAKAAGEPNRCLTRQLVIEHFSSRI